MEKMSVKKVSDLLLESVSFTFVVVLFLRLLNFHKYFAFLNADSRDFLYICRRGWRWCPFITLIYAL